MCTDCFQTQKQLQEQFASVNQAAKQLAINTGENVFIYQTPEGWKYMVESVAMEIGVQPHSVVSGLVPAVG